MEITISKHFALPPYTVQPAGGKNDWWYVANRDGFNCLHHPSGAKFSTKEQCEALAAQWNGKHVEQGGAA